MSVSQLMIASSCAQTLRVATIAAALRDSFSTVITKHVMVCIVNVPSLLLMKKISFSS